MTLHGLPIDVKKECKRYLGSSNSAAKQYKAVMISSDNTHYKLRRI